MCTCVCVCVCVPHISADQDQTDLRFSTWLPRGLRVCNVRLVWTTVIPLINYFINDLPTPLALSTIATIDTCPPEPITAEPTPIPHLLSGLTVASKSLDQIKNDVAARRSLRETRFQRVCWCGLQTIYQFLNGPSKIGLMIKNVCRAFL